MKKGLLLAIGIFISAMTSVSAEASTSEIMFAGVKWGSTFESANKILTEKGYKLRPKKTNYEGLVVAHYEFKLFQIDSAANLVFEKNKLIKIMIVMLTPDDKCLEKFLEVRNSFRAKYEEGDGVVEFKYPYELGDGYELQAIRLGKADIYEVWKSDSGDSMMKLFVSKQLSVDITYESIMWDEYMTRTSNASDL